VMLLSGAWRLDEPLYMAGTPDGRARNKMRETAQSVQALSGPARDLRERASKRGETTPEPTASIDAAATCRRCAIMRWSEHTGGNYMVAQTDTTRGLLLGLDVGTSAVKGVLTSVSGDVRAQAEAAYPMLTPRPGWVEQHPEDGW